MDGKKPHMRPKDAMSSNMACRAASEKPEAPDGFMEYPQDAFSLGW
jgi:hypothetical protein